ncbi:MAG: signal recognition particle protein [Simkaniaceae bacterium]|nr:MAG: signal recognition particle protein [Simkaniaceae bacterium]
MFGGITEKFQNVFSALASKKKLTDENISDAVREVRMALLDADVNYTVAKNFIKRVKEKALGEEVLKSVDAGDLFTKIIHDELKALMGEDEAKLDIGRCPSVILMCGLQGSGKTTQSAKLALYLKKQNKKVLIAACDLQRPAAIDQLETLGAQVEVPVYADRDQKNAVKVAKGALERAKKEAFDVLIVDTAGRLHIDEELMKELEKIKREVSPHEILFIANAATGQDAVKTAADFDSRIAITGTILTMLDGNTRAGAAISIREVTGKPLKFEGIGEKVTDLQLFNPQSMADRILGMGDVINLVKKAQEHLNEEEALKMEKKLRKATFTFDDFLKQMRSIKKMGSLKGLLSMVPGFNKMGGDFDMSDKELSKIEAIILSMTFNERFGLDELLPPRRRRIASGSGTSIDDVNRMIKSFKRIKQMMKKMPGMKKKFMNDPQMKDQLSALKGQSSSLFLK